MSYLALDLGAGSGRAIVGTIRDGVVHLEEVHRFANSPVKLGDTLYWDFLSLFENIKQGIGTAIKRGYNLSGIAVDTWGVDFGLIDPKGNILSNPVCYRDLRTEGLAEESVNYISKESFYSITGIQQMDINTVFQLWSMKKAENPLLSITDKLLFTPDLINYFLTGVIANEYTIASTSQMLDAQTKKWSEDVLEKLSLPTGIMGEIVAPCSLLGKLSENLANEIGIERINVFAVGSHDTASAIAAIPEEGDDWAFLSSGTWSLLGVLNDEPILTSEAMKNDFTNEGGVNNKILFMRNITGLWLLQRLIAEWEHEGLDVSYDFLLSESSKATLFRSIVNSDDPLFVHPISMKKAILDYCSRTEQELPQTQGELVRCVLESLAMKYVSVMNKLRTCSAKNFTRLHVVGGGSQNEQLNQYIADALNMEVVTGLTEATAIGNIVQQAIANEELSGWEDAHRTIKNSFEFKIYQPHNSDKWKDAILRTSYLFD